MQLEGATKLELRLYRASLDNEQLPPSEAQTALAVLLCDAANVLQESRRRGQLLIDACLKLHQWVEGHTNLLGDAEFLTVYNAICDAIQEASAK